jgi:hypothetical protein
MTLPKPLKPSAARQFTLSGGGVSQTLPSTTSFEGNRITASTFIENLSGLDGGVKVRNTSFDPLRLRFSGFLYNPNQLLNLAAIVGSRTITVSSGTYAITGEVSSYEYREIKATKLYSFSLEVLTIDSYWEGPSMTSAAFNGTGLSLAVLIINNTSPLQVEPVIRITKLTSATTPTNTMSITFNNASDGQVLTMNNFTVGVNKVLEVDYKNLTVTIDGSNALALVEPSFFTTQSALAPLSSTTITIVFPQPFYSEVTFSPRIPGFHIT